MLNLHSYLALPLEESIRLRIGPGQDDVVFFNAAKVEDNKALLAGMCRGIPAEGLSWRLLKLYTGGNGFLAKALIALGDYLDVWKMHPSADDDPWLWSAMHPMVKERLAKRGYPKPSAGDLDGPVCTTCGRTMGSHLHPSNEDALRCEECVSDGVEEGENFEDIAKFLTRVNQGR